jgi:hypothetical protein
MLCWGIQNFSQAMKRVAETDPKNKKADQGTTKEIHNSSLPPQN